MAVIDPENAPLRTGSGYPLPFRLRSTGRTKRALGDAAGLSDFGINLVTLPPGEWSSQRHWHSAEDEFVWVLEGELVLVTDAGERVLRAGECSGFAKGVPDAHHLMNRSGEPARYLEVGTRAARDVCSYPDSDLHWDGEHYLHKDGTPY